MGCRASSRVRIPLAPPDTKPHRHWPWGFFTSGPVLTTRTSAMSASLAPAEQMQLAVHFHSQGLLDNARTLYEGVLRQFPNDFAVLYHLGLLESQAGQTERAAVHFGRAVQADPRNADAQNNLAFTLQQLGRDAEALDAYARAL
eukprot:gene16943-35138_t